MECVRHLDVRSGRNIEISPLTSKMVQPGKDSAIFHDLLNSNCLPSFEDFNILCHENKKCI